MKSKAGRKTIMTKEVLGKLELAFSIGASDKEACIHANIHPDTLYEYQKKNPAFAERKAALKLKPVLKARQTIFNNLKNPRVAMWLLERKLPTEYNMQRLDMNPDAEDEGIWSPEEIATLKEVFGQDYNVLDDHDDD